MHDAARSLLPSNLSCAQPAFTTLLSPRRAGDVALTTDPTCTSIGTVRVSCTYDERVTMSLKFGATELIATATNEHTNETVEARIEYND